MTTEALESHKGTLWTIRDGRAVEVTWSWVPNQQVHRWIQVQPVATPMRPQSESFRLVPEDVFLTKREALLEWRLALVRVVQKAQKALDECDADLVSEQT